MGRREKQAYLAKIRDRYHKANREQKTKILDEFCAVCDYRRKYAIRLLSQRHAARPPAQRVGRKSRYNHPEMIRIIRRIWLATDQMCGKRLKAALPLWLPHDEAEHGPYTQEVNGLLGSISPASLDRLLRTIRADVPCKGLAGTKPGTLLKNKIPIRTANWDIELPGYMEADTVAHCGNSLAGDFVWSLTMTDILTGWTECRATWNKGAKGVMQQVQSVEAAIPFPLRGFDCDNGSEFLNHHLLRYFTDHPNRPGFTRSRPYKKNDNAHVEQKNWSQVRQLFGYDRFDNPRLVELMNDLYANEWSLLQNFFCPTLKLKEKSRIGSRYRKTYHAPQTPHERVQASESVSVEEKQRLRVVAVSLNPFELKCRIEHKLKTIFQLVSVTSNVRQRI
jgi:hypothetical protein